MRFFLFFTLLSVSTQICLARTFRGQIDFSSNSVTTIYELVMSAPRRTKGILCSHSFAGGLFVSVSGRQSDCSDAVDDFLTGANGSFGVDDFPVGNFTCVKTVSGTASSGFINCVSWWEGIPQ